MKKSNTIIIIGGGIIGLACAHYLNQEGAKIIILEQDQVGKGASHGNCGLLYFSDIIPLCSPGAVSQEILRTICRTSPLYIKPRLDFSLFHWLFKFAGHCLHTHKTRAAKEKLEILEYSSTLFKELFQQIPLDCDHGSKGILSVFKDHAKWKNYKKTNEFIEKFIPGYEPLSAAEALALEPALREDIAGAWYNRSDQHLRPDFLMRSWKNHLISQGVDIRENCCVTDIICANQNIRDIHTTKGDFAGDAFILATGAWSPLLGERLKLNIPVKPGKGYSITMERPEQCPDIPCMLYEKNMVVTPWESGYRLGGTMEFSGYGLALTPGRLSKLVDGASQYIRNSAGTPLVEEWTSLRPMTYDDMPIISRSPLQENLVIATGHGMLGLTLATGTGKLVRDLVLERKPEISADPYSLARFT